MFEGIISHGCLDQFLSRISERLAIIACLTVDKFVNEVQMPYTPTPTTTLLKRGIIFHKWLEGVSSKHQSCTNLPRQSIFSKNDNVGATTDGVKAMLRGSEWSNSILGEIMSSLQVLPTRRSLWNANRSVFSK
jgi:hypothetical protein